MNSIKVRIFSGLVLGFLLSGGVFAQKQNATETVKSFYKFHLLRSGVFSLPEVKLRKRWLTAELYKYFLLEIKREDEFTRKNPSDKPHFGDGFPFQPFEECVIDEKLFRNLYQVNEIFSEPNKAMVEIKFSQPKECGKAVIATYKVELLKTRNIWLINDWIYPPGNRLSEELKRKNY